MTNQEAINTLQEIRNTIPHTPQGDKGAVILGNAVLHLMGCKWTSPIKGCSMRWSSTDTVFDGLKY